MYAKDPYELKKCPLLTNKHEGVDIKKYNDSKTFIEYLNEIDDICENNEEYKPDKERKTLIVFDDMIADMLSNKKVYPVVTEWFVRGRKLKIFLVFITKSYFALPKCIILNSTHYFNMEILNKQEIQ